MPEFMLSGEFQFSFSDISVDADDEEEARDLVQNFHVAHLLQFAERQDLIIKSCQEVKPLRSVRKGRLKARSRKPKE